MSRLMECLEAAEGVEAQYAGVYILKWRSEWGPPEYLFREVDVVDDLLAACSELFEFVCINLPAQQPDGDEHDMLERARIAIARIEEGA